MIDFVQIVRRKLGEILAMPAKQPNNVVKRVRDIDPDFKPAEDDVDEVPSIHDTDSYFHYNINISEPELQEIKEGKPFPAWKFIPWILEELGITLKVVEKVVVEEIPEDEDPAAKAKRNKLKKEKEAAEAAEKARKAEKQAKR